MGATKSFGPVTLRNSGLGSVALGIMVVGAVPASWTIAETSGMALIPATAPSLSKPARVVAANGMMRAALPKPATPVERLAPAAAPATDETVMAPAVAALRIAAVDAEIAVGRVARLPLTLPSLPLPTVAEPAPVELVAAAPAATMVQIAPVAPMDPAALTATTALTPAFLPQIQVAAPAVPAPVAIDVAPAALAPVQPAEPLTLSPLAIMPIAPVAEPATGFVKVAPPSPIAALPSAMPEISRIDQVSKPIDFARSALPAGIATYGLADSIRVEQISDLLAARAAASRLAPPAPVVARAEAKPSAAAPMRRIAVPAPRLAATPQRTPASHAGVAGKERFTVTARGLQFSMPVVVNGNPGGRVPLLMEPNNTVSVRLADMLGAVRPLMDDATFARLTAASAAQEYVSFVALRNAGIDLRYDSEGDRLLVSAEAHD